MKGFSILTSDFECLLVTTPEVISIATSSLVSHLLPTRGGISDVTILGGIWFIASFSPDTVGGGESGTMADF